MSRNYKWGKKTAGEDRQRQRKVRSCWKGKLRQEIKFYGSQQFPMKRNKTNDNRKYLEDVEILKGDFNAQKSKKICFLKSFKKF